MTNGEYLGAGSSTTKLLLHLNGNSTDSSGNGNNGTDTSITYSQANGKFGMGAGFNGSSSFITVPNILDLRGPFTISCWAKFGANKEAGIVSKGLHSDSTMQWSIRTASVGANYTIRFGVDTNGTWGHEYDVDSTIRPNTTDWYYITAIHDMNNIKIYINGKLKGTLACNVQSLNSDGSIYIGSFFDTSSYFHNGSIDEVIIENIAWTPQQVAKYYAMAKGRFGII